MTKSPNEMSERSAADHGPRGGKHGTDQMAERVYAELRQIALRQLRRLTPGKTIQPTALVHEAFVKLSRNEGWDHTGHFCGAATNAMRQILVDEARKRATLRHGGGWSRRPLDTEPVGEIGIDEELLALDDALTALGLVDERAARVVEMRYFGGFSNAEIADTLGISTKTATRDWEYARRWLHDRLVGTSGSDRAGSEPDDCSP